MRNGFLLAFGAVLFLAGSAQAQIHKDYTEIQMSIREIAAAHPDHVQLFELGPSDSGLTIEGLKIGSGPVKNLVVATHHGNEYGSTEVAMAFAQELAVQPLDGQTVFVIPVLNISGYNARDRYESFQDQSQDPNRDYPGPCGTDGPFHLKSTAALAAFIDREGIVASATLHTYYPAVVYPWGISTHDLATPYEAQFQALVQAATQLSQYQTGNSTDVIYPADGTFEDYAFWKHGIWSILFELGNSHTPTDSEVDDLIRVNVPGLIALLQAAPHTRAPNHAFTGKCDTGKFRKLDRRDE